MSARMREDNGWGCIPACVFTSVGYERENRRI